MSNILKKFRNAHWFKGHLYAYKNLLKRQWRIRRGDKFIYNGELLLDTRCNFRCPHCSISILQRQRQYKQWMSVEEVSRVADELKRMGCFLCCVLGGEPTLRKDLCEIISVFHQRQILPTIITNAYLIEDEAYIRELKRAGLFNIGFSLNGATAESHDAFAQKPGSFEKVMWMIEVARELGICVSIALVPTHENIANGEYRKLIDFAAEKKIRVNVNYPALCGEWTGSYDELLTRSELEEIREYFKLPHVTSDFTVMAGKYECPAGRKKVHILSDGSVCPCPFMHISFGNILREPLEEIMDRIWSFDVFMSRPDYCLVSESVEFNEKYLKPVFKSQTIPLYYTEHPMFGPVGSDIREEAVVGVRS